MIERDGHGRPSLAQGVKYDVTERKRTASSRRAEGAYRTSSNGPRVTYPKTRPRGGPNEPADHKSWLPPKSEAPLTVGIPLTEDRKASDRERATEATTWRTGSHARGG